MTAHRRLRVPTVPCAQIVDVPSVHQPISTRSVMLSFIVGACVCVCVGSSVTYRSTSASLRGPDSSSVLTRRFVYDEMRSGDAQRHVGRRVQSTYSTSTYSGYSSSSSRSRSSYSSSGGTSSYSSIDSYASSSRSQSTSSSYTAPVDSGGGDDGMIGEMILVLTLCSSCGAVVACWYKGCRAGTRILQGGP